MRVPVQPHVRQIVQVFPEHLADSRDPRPVDESEVIEGMVCSRLTSSGDAAARASGSGRSWAKPDDAAIRTRPVATVVATTRRVVNRQTREDRTMFKTIG